MKMKMKKPSHFPFGSQHLLHCILCGDNAGSMDASKAALQQLGLCTFSIVKSHERKTRKSQPINPLQKPLTKQRRYAVFTAFQFFSCFSCCFFLFMPMLSSLYSLQSQKHLQHIKTCCEWGLILFELFSGLIDWDQMPFLQVGAYSLYSFPAFHQFASLYSLAAFQRP